MVEVGTVIVNQQQTAATRLATGLVTERDMVEDTAVATALDTNKTHHLLPFKAQPLPQEPARQEEEVLQGTTAINGPNIGHKIHKWPLTTTSNSSNLLGLRVRPVRHLRLHQVGLRLPLEDTMP